MKSLAIKIIVFIIIGSPQYLYCQVIHPYPVNQRPNANEYSIDQFAVPEKLWRNYDFVTGSKILFYAGPENEQPGSQPKKWEVRSGKAVIEKFDNQNVISFKTPDSTTITPLLTAKEYLPSDNFTIEFDIYFDSNAKQSITEYCLFFNEDAANRIEIRSFSPLNIVFTGPKLPAVRKNFDYNYIDVTGWHHVALSYDFGKLKFYFNDILIANEYISQVSPKNIQVFGKTYDFRENNNRKTLIKNFKIASGKKSLYNGIAINGQYATNAIRFDASKPFFKSESSGEINRFYKLMHDNPNWSFDILASSDNTLDEKYNYVLSYKRGESIKKALTDMGVKDSRLSVIGKKAPSYTDAQSSSEDKMESVTVEFILRP